MPHDDQTGAGPAMSVVIPTCNRREAIARCVESLARQTHPSYEVIVVDDASPDGTEAALARLAAAHPALELTYLRNERHAGANPSRNRGTLAARGRLVAFTDSDCVAEPGWLEGLEAAFASDDVGAVAGLTHNPAPRTIYDLAYRGTNRVHGRVHASRLVGCNMCVRRGALRAFMWDEDRGTTALARDGRPDVRVSGRSDEEGLYLMLRAAGWEVRVAPEAVVLHEHWYTRGPFFRQAFRGGRAAARLVHKYRLPPRVDLLPFALAYLTLPLGLLHPWLRSVPIACFAAALAAIAYNDVARKGKTVAQTARSFPVLVAYYHVRLLGHVYQLARLWLGADRLERVDLREVARTAKERRHERGS